jgi:anti-sigma factor RsiW
LLNCREVTARASRLLDGDLGLVERLQMRMHLAMCEHCRRFVRQLRTLVDALAVRHQSLAVSPSPEFVDRIMSTLPSSDDQ